MPWSPTAQTTRRKAHLALGKLPLFNLCQQGHRFLIELVTEANMLAHLTFRGIVIAYVRQCDSHQ